MKRSNRERNVDFQKIMKELSKLGFPLNDYYDYNVINGWEGYYEQQSYSARSNQGFEFSFGSEQHTYSCAIPTYGSFSGLKTPVPVMVLLLKLALLVDERQGYAQAITLTTPEYKNLNLALKQAGFVETARVRTRMGGRYKNIVWEYKK